MTSSSAPSANARVAKMLSICSVCPSSTGEALMQRILIGAPLSSTGGIVSDDVIKSPLQNTVQLSQPAGAISLRSDVARLAPSFNVTHFMEQCGFRHVRQCVRSNIQLDREAAVVFFDGLAVSFRESSPNYVGLGQLAVPV